MKKIYTLILAVPLIILTGCSGEAGDNLRYAGTLTAAISEKYTAENIEIKITEHEVLTINMVNAEAEDLSPAEKKKIAMEIGRMALSQERHPNFDSGVVNFVEKSNYFIATTTDSEAYDMFLKRGTSAQAQSTGPELER